MARCTEQGILFHTMTARPFWVGDVDITRRCPAPRLQSAPMSRAGGLRETLARLFSAFAGR